MELGMTITFLLVFINFSFAISERTITPDSRGYNVVNIF